jgi:predicted O-linked N-acetylglucosamine transferase (SPINDLY family)
VLRKLNLHELVASDEDEFVQKTVRLINDEPYRIEMVNKIKAINLYDNLCQTDEPQYFKKAIDYLLTNHQQLKEENSRQPIIIE